MNRADVYPLLSQELAKYRQFGFERLAAMIDKPPAVKEIVVKGETIVIEVHALWNDDKKGEIRLQVVALGPSTWRFERLDEAMVISADK
jgi:hypothetical protein